MAYLKNDHLGRIVAVILAVAAVLGACAQGQVEFDEDEGEGGATTTAVGGGGAGGATATGGTTTTNQSPCGIDCATITTPECQTGQCNEQSKQCEIVDAADGTGCDDGLFCTIGEVCSAGMCGGGQPNDCGVKAPPCTMVTCNENAKMCGSAPAGDGAPCAAQNLCEVNATCQNGLCIGQEKDCFFAPVPNECHVAKCNPQNGQCEPEPGNEGQGCTDQNDLCTDGKTCTNGTCVGGGPKDCSGKADACNDGVCDSQTGQCVKQPVSKGVSCPMNLECNTGECDGNGKCAAVPTPPGGKCTVNKVCNTGECDLNGKCQAKQVIDGTPCEDGNSCTSGESCTVGVCGGGQMVQQTIYFQEEFADNAKGWTLGTEWQIGPAKVSSGEIYGGPDPGTDHSATMDNGVAGVVIGGNANPVVHGWYYLTSPVIDTSGVQGTLWLQFWRWLNSDYLPYMQNVVEVFDGQKWVQLWITGSSPGIQDSAWQQIKHDISSYKSQSFQVRFGFQIGSSGVFTVSQWNVDDVILANVVCP